MGARTVLPILKRLGWDCSGATATEYGLLAAFVAVSVAGMAPYVYDMLAMVFAIIASR